MDYHQVSFQREMKVLTGTQATKMECNVYSGHMSSAREMRVITDV